MYVIKDLVSGCFLSQCSFMAEKPGDPWNIRVSSGKLGTTFYSNYDTAEVDLKEFEELNKQAGNKLRLQIVKVNPDDLPLGEAKNIDTAKIINFPKKPEDELELLYKEFAQELTKYICHDKCYKCGKPLNENDYVWPIQHRAGYGSKIDGSFVNIKLCDDCMIAFLKK